MQPTVCTPNIQAAAAPILHRLHTVENAGSKGSDAGVYAADGKATLRAVVILVEWLQRLRTELQRVPKV